jgi:hypothetical protein
MLRIVAAALLLSCTAASAQAPPAAPASEADGGRVMFERVPDGYLRMDTRSGKVSLCSRRNTGWVCEAVPEERTIFESEIAKLQTENAALKQELNARGLKLPETAKPGTPGIKIPDVEIRLPTNADLERAMTFLENMWRRLVDMIGAVQKEVLKT